MAAQESLVAVGGPATIGFRKIKGEWHCIALDFTIRGIGKTKQEAFDQMRELFEIYLEEAVNSERPVEFGCKAEKEDWDRCNHKEKFIVFAVIRPRPQKTKADALCFKVDSPKQLRRFRDRVEEFNLVAAGSC